MIHDYLIYRLKGPISAALGILFFIFISPFVGFFVYRLGWLEIGMQHVHSTCSDIGDFSGVCSTVSITLKPLPLSKWDTAKFFIMYVSNGMVSLVLLAFACGFIALVVVLIRRDYDEFKRFRV